MTKYVALLRGIAPLNPNMRNEKLRGVFESLGFSNVKTVISSGNVLFETSSTDEPALETMIEEALTAQLGFHSTTIIRSHKQLQRLARRNPFKGREHGHETYLKNKPRNQTLPEGKGYEVLVMHDRVVFSIVDLTAAKTPGLMNLLEKHFGKEITTRTWKTVERILKRLE